MCIQPRIARGRQARARTLEEIDGLEELVGAEAHALGGAQKGGNIFLRACVRACVRW
jgi:hypothetical protein